MKQRAKDMKQVGGGIVHRECLKELKIVTGLGIDVKRFRKTWTPRRTWAYRWLRIHGCSCRRRGSNRKLSVDVAASLIERFLNLQVNNLFPRKADHLREGSMLIKCQCALAPSAKNPSLVLMLLAKLVLLALAQRSPWRR